MRLKQPMGWWRRPLALCVILLGVGFAFGYSLGYVNAMHEITRTEGYGARTVLAQRTDQAAVILRGDPELIAEIQGALAFQDTIRPILRGLDAYRPAWAVEHERFMD